MVSELDVLPMERILNVLIIQMVSALNVLSEDVVSA